MQIDSNTEIAGVPILEVRRFLRETRPSCCWSERWLTGILHLSDRRCKAVVAQLLGAGYIERSQTSEDGWQNTVKGNALASASAAKPLHRQSAQKKLDEFLDRVRLVNSLNCEFLCWVEEVVLFGSMLTRKMRLSDIDVSVRLERKLQGEAYTKAAALRTQLAIEKGRSFKSFIEELDWPEREVSLFLKNRSRAISMVRWNSDWLAAQTHQVIYRRPIDPPPESQT
jgi:predicted nucleotidyltransferase